MNNFSLYSYGTSTDVLTVVRNTGNVGIGNTSPGYKLDINGDINISGSSAYKIAGTNICTNSGCTAASGSGNYIQNGTSPQSAEFNITGSGTVAGNLNLGTNLRDNRTNSIITQSLASVTTNRILTIGNATYGTITIPNGNVGIGAATPDDKLDIEGDTVGLRVTDTNGYNFTIKTDGAGGRLNFVRSGTNILTLNSAGNLGVGTTIPGAKLHVDGAAANPSTSATANGIMQVGNSDVLLTMGIAESGGSPYSWLQSRNRIANANYALILQPNGGNIGIGTGTTLPSAKLHVLAGGTLQPSYGSSTSAVIARTNATSTDAAIAIISGNTGSSILKFGDTDDEQRGRIVYNHSDDSLALYSNNQERLRVTSAGNVGIGASTNLGAKLTINGTIGTQSEGDIFSQYDGSTAAWYPILARYWDDNPDYQSGTFLFANGTNGFVGIEKRGGGSVAQLRVRALVSNFEGDLSVTGNTTFSGNFITFSNNARGYNVSVDEAETTLDVAFDTAHSDANYAVFCTPNWGTTCFVSNKSTTGFTLNFGTAAGSLALVDWFAVR